LRAWEEWGLQLVWLAPRGVNLPLARVGQKNILVDVSREIVPKSRVYLVANIVHGSQRAGFSSQFTKDSFLQPFDDNPAKLQINFIGKQQAAYGKLSQIYIYNSSNCAQARLSQERTRMIQLFDRYRLCAAHQR
jgi:hypothetical protein